MKSSNCEAIIVFDHSIDELRNPLKLKAVYRILTTYRFPMSLNPESTSEMSDWTSEDEFIQNKINTIDPRYQIKYVPKSLYQLFYIYYLFKQLYQFSHVSFNFNQQHNRLYREFIAKKINSAEFDRKSDELRQEEVELNEPYEKWKKPRRNLTFNWSPGQIGYYQYCNAYFHRNEVFTEWMTLNDFIYSCINKVEINENTIPIFIDKVAQDLRIIIESKNTQLDAFESYSSQLRVLNSLYLNDPQFSIIKNIINLEWAFKEKSYHIIYRGVQKHGGLKKSKIGYTEENGKQIPLTLSYSDGVFAGFCKDARSGMCFSYLMREDVSGVAVLIANQLKESSDSEYVFIPPISALAAINGDYEFHHPRSKVPNLPHSFVNNCPLGIACTGNISSEESEKNFREILVSKMYNDLSTYDAALSTFLDERSMFIKDANAITSNINNSILPLYGNFQLSHQLKDERKLLNAEIVGFDKQRLLSK